MMLTFVYAPNSYLGHHFHLDGIKRGKPLNDNYVVRLVRGGPCERN